MKMESTLPMNIQQQIKMVRKRQKEEKEMIYHLR